uniref:Alpha/beta hydrolase fold-3 domain-containing protein n=1 Tax=Ditylum brightwellii TaxID=49249 RepID=A0A6U3SV85_9STRA|mmetsp:Transcript_34213/g.51077  ORF Transcript_34213/g.51077 Transcript_34213/m.51077 type:complete len:420 (+) Transcript_34213:89-1348(+)
MDTSATLPFEIEISSNDENVTEISQHALLGDDPNAQIPPHECEGIRCVCWPCIVVSAGIYVGCCCCLRQKRYQPMNRMFEIAVTILRAGAHNCGRCFCTLRLITDSPIGIVPSWLPTLPKVNVSTNKTAPGGGEWVWPPPDDGKSLPVCHRYLPYESDLPDDPQQLENLGNPERVILYLHGGGFVLCSSKTHRSLLMMLSDCTGATILSPNYRRPPEHPWPVPVEDCVASYRWLIEVGKLDPSKIVFAGDSAGGGLVVATMAKAREEGLPLPAGGIMWSPWLDLTDSFSGTWTTNQDTDFLPRDWAYKFSMAYAGGKDRLAEASPGNVNLEGLPPLLVEVGDAECLRDSALVWVERAKAAGVDVEAVVSDGMVHVFPLFAIFANKDLPPHQSYERAASFVDKVLGVCSDSESLTSGELV